MRGVFLLMTIIAATLASALPVRADEVVGAIWKVEFKDDKASIRFQCTKKGKVFGPAGKEIGTWKGDGPQSVLKITDGGPRNGVYKITKMDKKPPTYRGQYTSSKGEDVGISVTLVKD